MHLENLVEFFIEEFSVLIELNIGNNDYSVLKI
jgi:hypothetical protein